MDTDKQQCTRCKRYRKCTAVSYYSTGFMKLGQTMHGILCKKCKKELIIKIIVLFVRDFKWIKINLVN